MPGLEAVWLSGSVARGEDTPSSALDIVIVGATDAPEGWIDTVRDALRPTEVAAGLRLSVLGLSLADWFALPKVNPPFLRHLRADAIPLVGPHPSHFHPVWRGPSSRRRRAAPERRPTEPS